MSDSFSVVSDLKPKAKQVNLKFKVISKADEREVSSQYDGATHKVAEAVVGDETGIVTMTLWDDQISQVEVGKTYVLKNGYVGFFRNTLRLNIGKYGSIEDSDEEIDETNMENDISQRVYQRSSSFGRYNNRRFDRF